MHGSFPSWPRNTSLAFRVWLVLVLMSWIASPSPLIPRILDGSLSLVMHILGCCVVLYFNPMVSDKVQFQGWCGCHGWFGSKLASAEGGPEVSCSPESQEDSSDVPPACLQNHSSFAAPVGVGGMGIKVGLSQVESLASISIMYWYYHFIYICIIYYIYIYILHL